MMAVDYTRVLAVARKDLDEQLAIVQRLNAEIEAAASLCRKLRAVIAALSAQMGVDPQLPPVVEVRPKRTVSRRSGGLMRHQA